MECAFVRDFIPKVFVTTELEMPSQENSNYCDDDFIVRAVVTKIFWTFCDEKVATKTLLKH